MSVSPYLTTEQVAERLHVSARSVRELTRLGRIPHRRMPHTRRCLFIPSELDAWLDGAALQATELADGGRIVKPTTRGEA